MPPSYQPHISPPSRHGSRPATCTREVTKAFATGSRSSTARAASRSLGSRTREVVCVNTGGASHTLESADFRTVPAELVRCRLVGGRPSDLRVGAAGAAGPGAAAPGVRPVVSVGDGDRGLARGHAVLLHLLGQLHGLVDQRLHDLRLGHGLDHLALDEDLLLAIAR